MSVYSDGLSVFFSLLNYSNSRIYFSRLKRHVNQSPGTSLTLFRITAHKRCLISYTAYTVYMKYEQELFHTELQGHTSEAFRVRLSSAMHEQVHPNKDRQIRPPP